MNEEKITLKPQKSGKSGIGKGGKPKEKRTDQNMDNELIEPQYDFENSNNPNVMIS